MSNEDFIPDESGEFVQIEEPNVYQGEVLDKVPKGDKMALVHFDGTAITERGNVVKHSWFKDMDISSSAYSDIVLTAEEARALRTAHQRMRTGASVQSVMTCWGASVCPRARDCIYVKLQNEIDDRGEQRRVVPLTKKCPIEQDILMHSIEKLALEFNVGGEEDEFTDQRLILELAEIEVMESRINSQIATDPNLQGFTEEKLVSTVTNKEGDVIDHYVKDVADLMKIKEKLWARKDRIRKELVATRREKRLVSAREGEAIEDTSVRMAKTLTKLSQLQAMQKGQ